VRISAFMLVLLSLFSLVLPALSTPLVSAAEDSWTILEPMPTARSGLGVAVVDGKIYAIGGWNDGYLSTNEMYDPETDTWTTRQSMPTARCYFAIGVYMNKIYVIGGTFGEKDIVYVGFPGVNEVYDPSTDTWETRESMPTARAHLDANVVGDKIYLIGGDAWPFGQSAGGLNEVYDVSSDSWSTNSPMPTNIGYSSSAVVDNKIYVIDDGYNETPMPTQIYDPVTDSWNYGKGLPNATYVAAVGATTGVLAPKRIYVIGGENLFGDAVAFHLNQIFDPETDKWTTGIPMPTPRWSFDVAIVNDELYAIGGYNGDISLTVNEKYTPIGYIPEYPSWMPLLVMIFAVLALTIVYRHEMHNQSKRRV
jgi:N-acetylneuraminic acid mutarotase